MGNNVTIPATGSGDATPLISTEQVSTLNGAGVTPQQVQRVIPTIRTGAGTAVDGGTTAAPFRTDPTGTTTQPVSGTVAVSGTVPVSAASLPLPTGAATDATLGNVLTTSDFDSKAGSLTETAPATDTASSGLNGRLQRIAQRLSSLIALLPSALVGGRLDQNLGSWLGSTSPTVGQKAMTSSVPVALASDQASVPVAATLQAGSAIVGKVTTDQTTHGTTDLVAADITKVGGSAVTLGSKASANSIPVVVASDQGSIPVAATLQAGSAAVGVVSTKTVLTASSPAAATVGVASAQAVASNVNRKGLVLTNTSINTISFGIGAAAVLNSGITLTPNGGTWEMDEYTFTTAAINAIAGAASSNLAIQEFTT